MPYSAPLPPHPTGLTKPDRSLWLAAGVILLAVALAYANSFAGAFVFDDLPSIVENQSIRSLPGALLPLSGPGQTVDGRPLLNFTLAVNYALGGLQPWGYHAVNLLIHSLAALTLLGLVRRTLLLPWAPAGWKNDALLLAAAVALLWALHPLQTAAVTYVVQRAESLCGLWYLLTLYGLVRYHTAAPGGRTRWFAVSVGSCLAGMATKEVMATAPLLALAYDRLFLSASWREIARRHSRIHLALAGTWALLLWLAAGTGLRGGTAEFAGSRGVGLYFLTQLDAICTYVRLACWPDNLVFDYGRGLVAGLPAVWPQALALVAAGLATLVAWGQKRPVAFCGLWFFLTLAPSSSLVPIVTQTAAEHRFYLPLAALATLAVLVGRRALGRLPWLALVLVASAICLFLTRQRNLAYHSPLTLWEDTARKRPDNARAQLNLGAERYLAGDRAEALARFRTAVRLDPAYSDAHNNLGSALQANGERAEALEHFALAVRLDPDNLVARSSYAAALAGAGRLVEADQQYVAALRAGAAADVRTEWALVLSRLGRTPEAEAALRTALREHPSLPAALALGQLLVRTGRPTEAEPVLGRAVQLDGNSLEARNSLGYLLLLLGRPTEAVPQFEAALHHSPRPASIRANLAVALARSGRIDEARLQVAEALALDPENQLALALRTELAEAPSARLTPTAPKH